MSIRIKRVYEQPSHEDGKRILVDRLWPRGLSKEKASVDLWLKDIAPAPCCANGLIMIRVNGLSLSSAISVSSKRIAKQFRP